jgi:hypothetical protein
MRLGRALRTVRSLRPIQLAARLPRPLVLGLVKEFPSRPSPRLVETFSEPPPSLRDFAASERHRFERRLEHLPQGSALRTYELQYGLELGAEVTGPVRAWSDPHALHAYPAAVRARRIATAIRCGRAGLGPELARAARAVAAQPEFHLLGNHLLENAIGLVCAASVMRGVEAELLWKIGSSLLDDQLEEQFLDDGGHFERSASYHLALTAGVVEAIELARAGGRNVPASWRDKATRALEWALAVRAPDGTYPLFNDAALDSAPSIDAVIALARGCGLAIPAPPVAPTDPWHRHLPSTGWWVAGAPDGTWMCADVGADGAPYQPGHVHADALTLELWLRGQRAIVDYGVSSYARDAARAETRATRSHNTVEIDGRDSCEVWGAFRVGRRCRARLERMTRVHDVVSMEAEHDGYAWLPGGPASRRHIELGVGRLAIEDSVHGGHHAGVSRLRLAREMTDRVDARGSDSIASKESGWHLEFARARDAVVLEQMVSTERTCRWEISWRS